MERSEPSLVPEWLRNTGGGTGSGSSSHHLASSQTDGPLLALPKRNRTSISNIDGPNSSLLDRSSSTNSRRSSSSNEFSKHDKNSYSRSYSNSTRNQHNKARETLGIADTWDSEYLDPLARIQDSLRRSQSLTTRRSNELSRGGVSRDLRNNIHNTNRNGNGDNSVASGTTGIQKVSFERDFPMLGSDERPITPDLSRVPSPGLGRCGQALSIGTSSLIGSKGWTSALAEVPIGAGSNSTSPSPALPSPPYAAAAAAAPSSPALTCNVAANGVNMAEAVAQMPLQFQNVQQQHSVQAKKSEELPSTGPLRLVPMTLSTHKTLVLNPSDKLKPKAAMRPNEATFGPKNGVQKMSSSQLGSQPVRCGGARADDPNSSAARKQLLRKPVRENGVSSSQTTSPPSVIANGQLIGAPLVASVPLKNPNNVKQVDRRDLLIQSRKTFLNEMKMKQKSNMSAVADSGIVVSSGVQNSDEMEDMTSGAATPTENGSEVKCNGDASHLAEDDSNHDENDLRADAVIYPNEEEENLLRSMGWQDSAGDEDGLTEEEINAFVQKLKIMKLSDNMKCRLASKILTQSDS